MAIVLPVGIVLFAAAGALVWWLRKKAQQRATYHCSPAKPQSEQYHGSRFTKNRIMELDAEECRELEARERRELEARERMELEARPRARRVEMG